MKTVTKLWLGILILAILSPIGLMLPEYFKSGPAFGELKRKTIWNAPVPDYSFNNPEGKGLFHPSLAYIISAVIGVAAVVIAVFLIGRKLVKKDS